MFADRYLKIFFHENALRLLTRGLIDNRIEVNIGSVNGLMPQVTYPLLEPMRIRIYIAIWRHYGTTRLTDMSKLLCTTPDIDICITAFILIYIFDNEAPIMWRTSIEIRDDYDKSTLVKVVDWYRQATSNYLSHIWRHQATL